MKKEILKPILQFTLILLIGAGIIIGTTWIVNILNKNKFETGYFQGYRSGYQLCEADRNYNCENKIGWIPQYFCGKKINDYCPWMVDAYKRGDIVVWDIDCFNWQQEEWQKQGEESNLLK